MTCRTTTTNDNELLLIETSQLSALINHLPGKEKYHSNTDHEQDEP